MSMESYIIKKKRQKDLETGNLKPMILSATEILTEKIMDELKPKIVKEAQGIVQKTVDNLVKNVRKGDRGDQGESIVGPPGIDGRNAVIVSKTQPLNPQKGDLWYKDD